jgi:hypothetical protein
MHKASRNWLSELRFIKDEQLFFAGLIKSYTLQLLDSNHFSKSKKIVDSLELLQNKNKALIETVIAHENKLLIMIDGIDQLKEEEAYKTKHRELTVEINEYFKNYRNLKKRLFETIETIMKNEKQKRLLK